MDKLRQQDINFDLFENFIITELSDEDAKIFIVEFFKQYKYLLSNDISRVTDIILLRAINIRKKKEEENG